ncbi:COQ9 family protein [Croceicoccus naphthovorans]|uniref:RpsU-divergently transcribed n=1 Tax=Croceicoccus naphthovorans TaxID=1348774 RepID=A0A0G3XDY8_9SPHN|nr:COQ9 family protein [Croceicoccus naphthovorans]AKM08819.1 RpsU-divergently transcribed [Croceicoccus naphthovorans]MBB3991716.1 ubiquinone biosynthesis protein COQ9 [Croceicoccus naphthovorans]
MPAPANASPDLADLTLEELAQALAPAVADAAIFDGWSEKAVAAAAELEGIDPDVARLAYPGGAMDMIAAWIAETDRAMAEALPADMLQQMGFGGRIKALLIFRLEHVADRREALRRALAVMAKPQNVVRAAKLGWSSADLMWRMAGDTAADFNHYSKRAILASIYAATLAVFVDDESENQADTYAFLDRRLEDVARFGKAKARLTGADRERFSPARLLGRLRYPVR